MLFLVSSSWFSAALVQLIVQFSAERVTGARQPRHDGADGDADDLGQLPVGQTFDLAEYQQLVKPIREIAQRTRDQRGVVGLQQKHFGIGGHGRGGAVLLLVEWIAARLDAAAAPAGAGVTHDSEEPRPPIAAGERPEVLERTQRRLLHDIFGIVFVAHQPPGQSPGGPEMRHDDLVKRLSNARLDCRPVTTVTHGALPPVPGAPAPASGTGT